MVEEESGASAPGGLVEEESGATAPGYYGTCDTGIMTGDEKNVH